MRNRYRDELLLDADEELEDDVSALTRDLDEIAEIIEETKKEIEAIFASDALASKKKVTKNA